MAHPRAPAANPADPLRRQVVSDDLIELVRHLSSGHGRNLHEWKGYATKAQK